MLRSDGQIWGERILVRRNPYQSVVCLIRRPRNRGPSFRNRGNSTGLFLFGHPSFQLEGAQRGSVEVAPCATQQQLRTSFGSRAYRKQCESSALCKEFTVAQGCLNRFAAHKYCDASTVQKEQREMLFKHSARHAIQVIPVSAANPGTYMKDIVAFLRHWFISGSLKIVVP